MKFSKCLAKYYRMWYQNCINSVQYCIEHNEPEKAEQYKKDAEEQKQFNELHKEAIDYFSSDESLAFKYEQFIDPKFRDYEEKHQK